MRQHLSAERTRLINHVRGLLSEYGLILNKGSTVLRSALPGILEDELSWYDKQLKLNAKNDEVCQRLIKTPVLALL